MKIAEIVGTRPQFIKLSQVSRQIRGEVDEIIIHTGQHYDDEMDRLFFEELELPEPDFNLGVGSGSHGAQTGEMLKKIEMVLEMARPDRVLVYGDCNTTLAGALSAVKLGIPVGHVEAGCRTYTRTPEEINRRCVDHISDELFAISDGTAQILISEKAPGWVFNVGSVMVDACLAFSETIERKASLDYSVLTMHRPENVDDKRVVQEILASIYRMEEEIVFPIHPRTRKNLARFGLLEELEKKENIQVTPPLGYLEFLGLLKNAWIIISDSGSIQQEAITLRKRCVRLLEGELFPELASYPGGVYAEPSRILGAIDLLDGVNEKKIREWTNPLGDGDASKRIAEIILAERGG
jgi:UDP-N-acetylglucosamine 2-epimerase (non-hydrolysing)